MSTISRAKMAGLRFEKYYLDNEEARLVGELAGTMFRKAEIREALLERLTKNARAKKRQV